MRTSLPVLLALLSAFPLNAAELSVGFAAVDISPDVGRKPVFMAGFGQNRLATKVHDPIMARAVVLHDGQQTVALVSVDLVGFFRANVENVRKQLPLVQHLVVSSTHNHEGPDTLGLWGPNVFTSGVEPDYLTRVEAGIVKAVTTAQKQRTPATAKLGTATGPELLHDARKPIVKHDELVALHFQSSQDSRPLGLLVQWNCHPETLDDKNTELSADYVAATVRSLQERHRCPVAYFTGSVGGLMTSLRVDVKNAHGQLLKDGTFEKTEAFGLLVADLADRAMKTAKPIVLTPFSLQTQIVLLPVDNGLYKLASQVGKLKRTMYEWTGDPRAANPKPTMDISGRVAIRTELNHFKLGELEVAGIPGEIYPELVLDQVVSAHDPGADYPDAPIEPALYKQMRSKHKMLLGLANDEIGYIIPKRQWDEKPPFCFGLKKPQYGEINSLGAETAPILCQVFREMAQR